MKIALIVDNPKRDLPGLILLGMHLCQQDLICYLIPSNLRHEIWALKPDFALFNYLRVNNQEMIDQLTEAGIKIGILETEGGVFASLDHYGQLTIPDERIRSKISCYCSWGAKVAEYLIQNGLYQNNRVYVTGAPRFDLYSDRWKDASLAFSSYSKKIQQPMILINGNFPIANPKFKTPEEEAKMLVELFGHEEESVFQWQSSQKRAMEQMAKLANSLAEQFPQINIVYRPHPFENLSTYHRLLETRENLHLINEGTADGWIMRSCCIIQRGCSTAIEANMCGKPALSPQWIDAYFEMESAESVSVPCHSEKELRGIIEMILSGSYTPPDYIQRNFQKIITDWFTSVDGNSHARVINTIMENFPEENDIILDKICREGLLNRSGKQNSYKERLYSNFSAFLCRNANIYLLHALNRKPDFSLWENGEKAFTIQDVQNIVKAIESVAIKQSGKEWSKIGIETAEKRKDYHYGYKFGRTITLYPLNYISKTP